MLTCKEASHLVSQNQDRPLSFNECLGLRIHLWMCVNCRRFERQIGLMRRLLRQSARSAENADTETQLSAEAQARIRQAMDEQQKQVQK
jgi:predicted anti-sigma-YlaC factor YlaD